MSDTATTASVNIDEQNPNVLSDADVQTILSNYSSKQTSVSGYTPAFNDTVRTVIYVVCFILGLLGGVATVVSVMNGAPTWMTIAAAGLGWTAPQIANAFGVAYNPLKLAA